MVISKLSWCPVFHRVNFLHRMSFKQEIDVTLGIAHCAVMYQRALNSELSLHFKPLDPWGGSFLSLCYTVQETVLLQRKHRNTAGRFSCHFRKQQWALRDRVRLKNYFNFQDIPLLLVTATQEILKIQAAALLRRTELFFFFPDKYFLLTVLCCFCC